MTTVITTTSRIGRMPVVIPNGVSITLKGNSVEIKGPKGAIVQQLPTGVVVAQEENQLVVSVSTQMVNAKAQHGTYRALLANHVKGVSEGYVIKLLLVGVGYRAQASKLGDLYKVDLILGKSHPEHYVARSGVKLETPAQTEILISGANREHVGQAAAEIQAHRMPDAYKGKGIRYDGRKIVLKEVKKK
ncbi:MAG: 50S ribosomal protein L6 [Pseudomonadota bacterium]